MIYSRQAIVELARSKLGNNEADGSHKDIIDMYNSYLPHPRGYKLKYSDSWCAGGISALAIELKYTDIIPIECSCSEMIKKLKSINCWIEDDAYIPKPGDLLFFDWQDTDKQGLTDNKDMPDHVGLVEYVDDNYIHMIEFNSSDAVRQTKIKINGQYIRGFGCPKYDEFPNTINDNAHSWSKDARDWSVKSGIVKGNTNDDNTNYQWNKEVTKEELVQILYRFNQLINK